MFLAILLSIKKKCKMAGKTNYGFWLVVEFDKYSTQNFYKI
jgi:hypothetical protein